MSPVVGFNNLASERNKVDFPQPLEPIKIVISPFGISKFNSSIIIVSP